jgi:hypothetical protein
MPSRKQRKKRAKANRHEYEYVLLDDEGNEVPDEPAALRKKKDEPKAKRGAAKKPAHAGRTIQPPSWRRVGKRALIFAPFMFITVSLLSKHLTLSAKLLQVGFLLGFFLPFSYVMDTVAYRTYLRRTKKS